MAVALTPLLIPGLAPNFEWSYLGYLPEERQWAPALGLVAGKPTIATGKKGTRFSFFYEFLRLRYFYLNCLFRPNELGRNYGDVSMATLESEHHWTSDHNRHLRFKREFSTSLSLPHSWMPSYCEF